MLDSYDEMSGWVPPLASRFPAPIVESLDPYNVDPYTPDPYSWF
jgi:hypothetical protein